MKKTYVYVSGWRRAEDLGICQYVFDRETGEMTFMERFEGDCSLSVSVVDHERGLLYALDESADLPTVRGGGGGGRIFVFRIDKGTGKLETICIRPTFFSNPAYLSLDKTGKYLIVANHGGRSAVTKVQQSADGEYYPVVEHDDTSVELFSLKENGEIDRLLDVCKHTGNGPGSRQVIAHPHCVVMSPSGNFFGVCDKGNDTVGMYRIDYERGRLIPPSHIVRHTPGTMPRYCVFHPVLPYFYHNDEHALQLNAYRYTEEGEMIHIGAWPVSSEELERTENAHEQQGLAVAPSGKYLYSVVRGPNVITVFKVREGDGSLECIQHKSVAAIGKWPRGCTVSPDGRFLLVCCLEDGVVQEFRINEDGTLSDTDVLCTNPAAAHAVFYET